MSTAVMTSSSIYTFKDIIKSQSESQLRQATNSHHDLMMSKLSWGISPSSSGGSSPGEGPVGQGQGQDGGGGSLLAATRPTALPINIASFLDDMNNSHRRLDRSQSEPSKTPGINVNTSRYKTELCRPYEESGTCKYGDKCQFAHGEHELRGLVRHPKYKTELCRTFHTVGFCPYGPRCHFIHNADEARSSGGTAASSPTGKVAPPVATSAPISVGAARSLPAGLAALATSPASSLGSISPPPVYSFPSQTRPSSPPSPPVSPDSTRLPVFNRISPPFNSYALRYSELLA